MSTSHSILFLSGAGLPAWIWDDVRHELSDHRTTVAPRPENAAGLQDYAAAALASVDTERFSIVAHSAGGVVASEICRLAPERVEGLLAISAIIPRPGGSFLSAMPAPNRWILGLVLRFAGTRPPEAAIRQSLAHGLAEPIVDRVVADFTPEPLSFYRDRTGTPTLPDRREYLTTSHDRELPLKLQERFAAHLGASDLDQLPTGHLPMLEDPAAVARAVGQFSCHRVSRTGGTLRSA